MGEEVSVTGGRDTCRGCVSLLDQHVFNEQAPTFIQKVTITSGSRFGTPNFPFPVNSIPDSRSTGVFVSVGGREGGTE